MAKVFVMSILFLAVIFISPASSHAYTEISLQIDSSYAEINGGWHRLDAAPYIKNGRTMVPLRFISEAFGARVSAQDSESGLQGIVEFKNVVVYLLVGDQGAHFVNEYGEDLVVHMDVAPEIQNDRMFVPLRFIASNFGCDVSWDEVEQVVTINQID